MNDRVIAGLTEAQLKDLESLFDAARTASSSVSREDPTWRHISVLPVYIDQIGKLADRQPSQMRLWAVKNPPADAAFNHAHFALNGARDGLVGLYAEVVKAGIITPSTVYLLMRQTCEAALTARWLLEDPSPRGLIRHGFAAEWADYLEHKKFADNMFEAKAVEMSQTGALREKVSNEHRRLIQLGREHRLLKSGDSAPELRIPSGTDLFKSVEGPEPHTDMRWLFNLLSGVLHSRTWATLLSTRQQIIKEYLEYSADGMPVRSDIVLARTDPNLEAMLLPVQVAMLQVHSALERFHGAESQEAPSL